MKVVVFIFSLLSFTCYSQVDCQTLPNEPLPTLKLYTENWAPYQFVNPQNQITGVAVEKIKTVLNRVNWPYEINVYPWARAVHLCKNVENSFIFSVARFPEREKEFQWVAPLTTVTSKLLRFNNNKKIIINTLDDIKNYTIILKRGEASSVYFAKNNLITPKKTIWVTDSSQALKLLEIGRGDIYPEVVEGFSEALKIANLSSSQFSSVYDFKELDVALYLATSLKTHPKIVNKLATLFKCYNTTNS